MKKLKKPATWNHNRLATNLRKLWDSHVDEDIHEYGYYWYRMAHEWASELAHRYDVPLKKVAGIAAALSPGVSWPVNKQDTEKVIQYHLGIINYEPTVSTYRPNMIKARHIFEGYDPIEVLGGNKTTNFYLCILNPYDNHAVCIDRHAIKAARGMSKGGGLSVTNAQYAVVAEVYRSEAQTKGLLPMQYQAVIWEAYKLKHNR